MVFFLGVFMKRLNGKGCLAALLVGFAMGLFRLAVDTPMKLKSVFPDFQYTEGSFLWIVNNIYFQYYSVLIFLTCSIVMIAVSYVTAAPDYEKIKGLTFATQTAEDRRQIARQLDEDGPDLHDGGPGPDPDGLHLLQRLTRARKEHGLPQTRTDLHGQSDTNRAPECDISRSGALCLWPR